MVASKVKYLAVELDSVDLADQTERLLVKDDLAFGEVGDSQAATYNAQGNLSAIEFFIGTTQTTPYRKARAEISYNSAGYPTTETWHYYESDGMTVKRTVTLTHTWTAGVLTSTTESVT